MRHRCGKGHSAVHVSIETLPLQHKVPVTWPCMVSLVGSLFWHPVHKKKHLEKGPSGRTQGAAKGGRQNWGKAKVPPFLGVPPFL